MVPQLLCHCHLSIFFKDKSSVSESEVKSTHRKFARVKHKGGGRSHKDRKLHEIIL